MRPARQGGFINDMQQLVTEHWLPIKDGDPRGLWLFNRHYSKHWYKDTRRDGRFVGPGERLVLMTVDCQALWVWRKMKDGGGDHHGGLPGP